MSYAILRIEKLKTLSSVRGSSRHMTRSRDTPNADPSRRDLNEPILGAGTAPAELVEARIQETGRPVRKNGVLALEVFAGMSPEWAAKASEADLTAWVRDSQAWLSKTFGDDNLVSLTLHRDETTPHLTGLVVPVDPTTGRLNAARWVDGREKLAGLQDGYAAAVEHLGLERGLHGSKAKHTTIKQFYGAMRAETVAVKVPEVGTPPVNPLRREEWRQEEQDRLQRGVNQATGPLRDQARHGIVATRKAREHQATAESLRATANLVRELPLTEVVERLGLRPDPVDKQQWRDDERRFRVTLRGQKFMDHTAGKGGGGAIDLAMHVLERDYQGAVSWLAGTVGADRTARDVAADGLRKAQTTVREAQQARPVFEMPQVPTDRDLVKRYLGRRGIHHEVPDVVSDKRRNVGFVMRDAKDEPRGLELKGTGFQAFTGLAPGSSREAAFSVTRGVRAGRPYDVVLTESAIDALSYAVQHGPTRHPDGAWFISTAGTRGTLPEAAQKRVEGAARVFVAYDNDEAGQKAAQKLIQALRMWFKGAVERVRSISKDWNQDLLAAREGRAPTPAPSPVADRQRQPSGGPGIG